MSAEKLHTIKKLESECRISMNYIEEMNRTEHTMVCEPHGISSVACWVCNCVCMCRDVEGA